MYAPSNRSPFGGILQQGNHLGRFPRRAENLFTNILRGVARRFGLTETTVRAIDLRYLKRWAATRREPPLRHMGVDEIYRGISFSRW
jgi:hypothetical protein